MHHFGKHPVEDITTKLNNGPVDKEILFIRFYGCTCLSVDHYICALVQVRMCVCSLDDLCFDSF